METQLVWLSSLEATRGEKNQIQNRNSDKNFEGTTACSNGSSGIWVAVITAPTSDWVCGWVVFARRLSVVVYAGGPAYRRRVGRVGTRCSDTPHPFYVCCGGVLLSHTLPGAVPSALAGLASRFGMDAGRFPAAMTTTSGSTSILDSPRVGVVLVVIRIVV